MKKRSNLFFVFGFIAVVVMMFVGNAFKERPQLLTVSLNTGIGQMETIGDYLIAGFQDGRICRWSWDDLSTKQGDFSVGSNRFAILNEDQIASISKTGKKTLAVYQLSTGKKIKDIQAGFDDQDIWPKAFADHSGLALIRKNPIDSAGKIIYEFLTVDIEKEFLGIPLKLVIEDKKDNLVDYAVDAQQVLYAAGSRDKTGRVIAMDLNKRSVRWDRTYEQTQEFCSVIVSPNGQYLLAGNRNGLLYKLDSKTGDILGTIQLLEEGEQRPVTNDYSVLNSAFSNDGQYFVATINPKVYIMKTPSFEVIHTASPADRLVSKVAFSLDNLFFATSDIRAGYPIKVWQLPTENK